MKSVIGSFSTDRFLKRRTSGRSAFAPLGGLHYTGVTAEGVARLQRALPLSTIRWGNTIEELSAAIGRYFGD